MAYTQLGPFHSTGVTSLNFSPDGLLLCSTSLDGTVALWDKNDLKPVPLVGHQDSVNCSVFFSDNVRLVTAGEDANALLWDVRNPSQPVGQFAAMGSGVNVLALGQNGTILYSASDDGCIVLHDVATGEVVDKFMVGSDAVNDLQVLDGVVQGLDLLIVGSEDKSVRTWLGGRPADVAAFREQHPAPEPIDDEEDMELDEEAIAARAAAAASHRNTRLLDSADEFEMAINHVHYDSNSGTLFAACANCIFEVAIDVSTGMLNRETDAVAYEGHSDFVRGFVTGINAEGQRVLYTAGDDRMLAEWHPGQAATPFVSHNDAHNDMIMAMAGSPCGGLLATGSEDSVIRIWGLPLQH